MSSLTRGQKKNLITLQAIALSEALFGQGVSADYITAAARLLAKTIEHAVDMKARADKITLAQYFQEARESQSQELEFLMSEYEDKIKI